MGWTDNIVGASSKVGRLILDTSQPILNQIQPHRNSPRRSSTNPQVHPSAEAGNEVEDDPERLNSKQQEEFQAGPDTSSLSAFIYSFISPAPSPRGDDGQASKDDPSTSSRADAAADADWCVVSTSELEQSFMEDYMFTPDASPLLPSMSEDSCLLSERCRRVIHPLLPYIVKDCQWVLMYSTARDGISLMTLYRKSVLLPGPCLLVAGDTRGAVFGGLLVAPLKPSRSRYQGSSQTFVFTDVSGQPKVYRPTGLNRYYYLCTNEALAIGGGGHFALHLENDLLTGSSGACETFGSDCLAHTDEFDLKDVELWGFSYPTKYTRR